MVLKFSDIVVLYVRKRNHKAKSRDRTITKSGKEQAVTFHPVALDSIKYNTTVVKAIIHIII